ncbi:MAG TPA: hypothetical protein ENN84_02905, partial [Candidatus Marinimicrobia bacterium]|nr:hypothetical protein [Candidatus Neomarinimicrobiota bacterium]
MIYKEPQMVNHNDTNFDPRLLDYSPAIHAGTPDTSGLGLLPQDIDGNPRVWRGRVDIGAFENQSALHGIISEDESWTWPTNPLYGDLEIADGATLSMGPGVNLTIHGHHRIQVHGRLLAQGNSSSYVSFTMWDTAGFKIPDTGLGGWDGIHFDNISASNDSSILEYVYFEFAKAYGDEPDGAAIYVNNAPKLRIENCQFYHNWSMSQGGAMALIGFDGILRKNYFSENTAGYGGALAINASQGLIVENTFFANKAMIGGAINIGEGSTSAFINNDFLNNIATTSGGALYLGGSANPEILKNHFSENSAESNGGALSAAGSASGILENNLFVNNSSNQLGGALVFAENASTAITNNTIAYNHAKMIGGGMAFSESSPTLNSNIIWGNSADTGSNQIYLANDSADPNFKYSDIEGGKDAFVLAAGAYFSGDYRFNIDIDPLFTDAANSEFTLMAGSPAIDAGDPSLDYSNEPLPNGGRINMGAYGNTEFAALSQGNRTWFVEKSGNDSNDGYSWSTPFASLEKAVSSAIDGDEILIGYTEGIASTYYHSYEMPINKSLRISSAIKDLEETFYSATPSSEFVQFSGLGVRGFMVIDGAMISDPVVIQGLNISNCSLEGSDNTYYGGAILIKNTAHVDILNCKFEFNKGKLSGVNNGGAIAVTFGSMLNLENSFFQYNYAMLQGEKRSNQKYSDKGVGAAVFVMSSEANISDCTFKNNKAAYWSEGFGGAIAYTSGAKGLLADNYFESNRAGDDFGFGGAIYLENANPIIKNNTFYRNTGGNTGGGYGGVIAIDTGSLVPLIQNNFFNLNWAAAYGGTSGYGGAIWLNSWSETATDIIGNVFHENIACTNDIDEENGYGGAIAVFSSAAKIAHNTFDINQSRSASSGIEASQNRGSGIYLNSDTSLEIHHNIFSNHSHSYADGLAIYSEFPVNISYNGFHNNAFPDYNININSGNENRGDPLYESPDSLLSGFELTDASPFINAGNKYVDLSDYNFDAIGQPRLFGGRIDLGALENQFVSYSYLSVVPDTLDFGMAPYGSVNEDSITISNISSQDTFITVASSFGRNDNNAFKVMNPLLVGDTIFPMSNYVIHIQYLPNETDSPNPSFGEYNITGQQDEYLPLHLRGEGVSQYNYPVLSGVITENVTIATGDTVIIQGELTITSEGALNINAGAIVYMAKQQLTKSTIMPKIISYGVINITGEVDNQVIFTPYEGTDYLNGIEIHNLENQALRHFVIDYGSASDSDYPTNLIEVYNSGIVTLEYVAFSGSSLSTLYPRGIYLNNSSFKASHVTFDMSALRSMAIYSDGASGEIEHCDFLYSEGSSGYGMLYAVASELNILDNNFFSSNKSMMNRAIELRSMSFEKVNIIGNNFNQLDGIVVPSGNTGGDITIEANEFKNNGTAIRAEAANLYVRNNYFFRNLEYQAFPYASYDESMIILANSGSTAVNFHFYNNTVFGSRSSSYAIEVNDYTELAIPSVNLKNNIIYSWDQFPLNMINGNWDVSYSNIEHNSLSTDGMLDTDPRLADSTYMDLHLTLESPCINAGTPDTSALGLPPVDYWGNPRVQNSRIDMGAHELYRDMPPSAGTIIPGPEWSSSQIAFSWNGFSDDEGIEYFEISVGSLDDPEAFVGYHLVAPEQSSVIIDTLILNHNTAYYPYVAAIDSSGQYSERVRGDSTKADLAAPLAGQVFDGLEGELDWTNDSSIISARWTGFSDSESGVAGYFVSIGTTPGGENLIYNWFYLEGDTSFIISNVEISHGTTYYVNVYATDSVNNNSEVVSSDGVRVDKENPVIENLWIGESAEPMIFTGQTDTLKVQWTASDAKILSMFELALGYQAGGNELTGWITVENIDTYTFYDLNLETGMPIWATLKAYDIAGNFSDWLVSADSVIADTLAPIGYAVWDGPADSLSGDLFYSNQTDSVHFRWEYFTDDLSGISHYEARLRLQDGTHLTDWQSIIDTNHAAFGGLSLQNDDYIIGQVKAVDLAGNLSQVYESNGFRIDLI